MKELGCVLPDSIKLNKMCITSFQDYYNEPATSPPPLELISNSNLPYDSDSEDENLPLSSLKTKLNHLDDENISLKLDMKSKITKKYSNCRKSSDPSKVPPFMIKNAIDYFNGENKPICPICNRDSEYETTDDSDDEKFCENKFQTWDQNQTRVKWLKQKNAKYKSRKTSASTKNARNKIQVSYKSHEIRVFVIWIISENI